jgi:hypothetical protein
MHVTRPPRNLPSLTRLLLASTGPGVLLLLLLPLALALALLLLLSLLPACRWCCSLEHTVLAAARPSTDTLRDKRLLLL